MYLYTTFYLLPSFWRFFDIFQRKSVKARNWNCFISWKTNKQAEAPLNSRRRVRNQRKKRKRLQRRKGNNEFKLKTNAIIDGLSRRLRKELDHGATPASAFPCSEILFKMEDKQRYIDSGIREKSWKLTSTSRFWTQTKVSLNYRHAPALHERWTWFWNTPTAFEKGCFGCWELGFGNEPFLSSFEPLFQSESVRSLCNENKFSFVRTAELITITKSPHFEIEAQGNSEMAYRALILRKTIQFYAWMTIIQKQNMASMPNSQSQKQIFLGIGTTVLISTYTI